MKRSKCQGPRDLGLRIRVFLPRPWSPQPLRPSKTRCVPTISPRLDHTPTEWNVVNPSMLPRSPQPLLSFSQFLFFLAAPAPPARSPQTCSFSTFHCFRPVLGRHISQPPPAQDNAVSIVLSAPFGRHNYFVVSTHVFVSHFLVAAAAAYFQHICLFRPSWSPQPLRSI